MKSFGLTDKGKIRAQNQDCFLLELCPDQNCLIVSLCDGMGGANAGEVASALCNKTFVSKVFEKLCACKSKSPRVSQILQSACVEANAAVYEYSRFHEEFLGMGTTLVGGVIKDNGTGHIINVGDSRAYLIQPRKNEIRQISQDHSLVAELVRFGAITPEEAREHPRKNVITRAVGTEAETDPDVFSFKLGSGELLLLCSDGLSNQIRDEEMLEEAKTNGDPESLCRRLMDMVLGRGAQDNVTVVVVAR